MKNMPPTQTNKVRKTTQSSFYWDHVLTQLSKNEKRPQYIYIYKKHTLPLSKQSCHDLKSLRNAMH